MKNIAKDLVKLGIRAASAGWKPYSRLVLLGDGQNWSLDHDMREIRALSKKLGIQTAPSPWRFSATPQAQLYFSHYTLVEDTKWLEGKHRIGITFPEGVPPVEDKPKHRVFQAICRHSDRIHRIQVSHPAMREYILESGIDPGKVFVIPIGINLSFFRYRNQELRTHLRTRFGIPEKAFVIGSFQKDGTGWGDGLEPKLVKGPDIFLETIEKLKPVLPELFVLLIGPARGYVKAGLDRLSVRHASLGKQPYPQACRAYAALDLYLVTSRQEGGPKAILEAMASGVPLVTTRVGQAMELVKHGQNGWMADVEDVNGLAQWASQVYHKRDNAEFEQVLQNGRTTAESNSYERQQPLWRNFMRGFVEWEA